MRWIWAIAYLVFGVIQGLSQTSPITQKESFTLPSSTQLILPILDTVMVQNQKSIMIDNNLSAPKVEYNTTIFCKFEHKLMMSSRLPLKMRLGDVQYVDRLEGKR